MQNYRSIAFQGAEGAYSDLACRTAFPDLQTVPCRSFDDAFRAVNEGEADLAMIPIDNTIAGRVADVHTLMPQWDLFIIGEHFQPINHMLLGVSGASVDTVKQVYSHVHAIPQCRKFLNKIGAHSQVSADTAAAAKHVVALNDVEHGAIASELAAETYGLDILERNIEDEHHNVTRFLILSTEPDFPSIEDEHVITSLLFAVRNRPACLYKALGGFATNGLSMTKLESYVDQNFHAARFYCDVEGHPESLAFQRAVEELGFYSEDVKLLGSYPAHPFRQRSFEHSDSL